MHSIHAPGLCGIVRGSAMQNARVVGYQSLAWLELEADGVIRILYKLPHQEYCSLSLRRHFKMNGFINPETDSYLVIDMGEDRRSDKLVIAPDAQHWSKKKRNIVFTLLHQIAVELSGIDESCVPAARSRVGALQAHDRRWLGIVCSVSMRKHCPGEGDRRCPQRPCLHLRSLDAERLYQIKFAS